MNPEQITQIIETIKTLNLNVDSQSMVQIVQALKPVLWFILIKDLLIGIAGLATFALSIYIISKAVLHFTKQLKD